MQLTRAEESFEDRYELLEQIGAGRFAKVFKGRSRADRTICAVKVVDKCALTPSENEMLKHELVILKGLSHPNVARLFGTMQTSTHAYLMSELVSGGELHQLVENTKRLAEDDAALVAFYVLKAVQYIHSCGITHRDIKPENVLIMFRNDADRKSIERVKLIDFGLSSVALPSEPLFSQCGTLSYIAPEVLLKAGYGKEADVWSLGMVTYYAYFDRKYSSWIDLGGNCRLTAASGGPSWTRLSAGTTGSPTSSGGRFLPPVLWTRRSV